MRIGVLFFVLVLGCSSSPSKVDGAPKRAPDDAYETDGGHAWRVLVWKCDASNERIAMIQECGEGLTGCGKWHVERTLCPADPTEREATRTPGERAIEEKTIGNARHPIPDGSGWR